jgi:Cytochrome c7 and related cytochrome c
MPALFSRSSNRTIRLTLAAAAAALVGIPLALMAWVRTPAITGQRSAPAQPIPFDHRIHVTGLQIDCRYCHSTAERSAPAGVPATTVCVPCHSQVWRDGPVFAPVRHSLATGRPIPWQRVNSLPDFVFFNHAIHVRKGVGCETCHGRVDRMARVEQAAPLTMSWCLDCHRGPERYLRPVEQVTTMGWQPPGGQAALGRELVRRYHVSRLTNCSACHR